MTTSTHNPAELYPEHRLVSVDILRGAVIILMALDHTRDFFSNVSVNPVDLTQTSIPLFLTRWITHFCAPVFIFLAGASAYLVQAQYPDPRQLCTFLLKRSLLILFLGITFESLIWSFTPDFSEISGAVLWAIGWSMMALAGFIRFLPMWGIVLMGLAMITGHNVFDHLTRDDFGAYSHSWGNIWAILHSGETVRITDQLVLHPFYPLIPWIGVMAVGYGFGKLLLVEKRRQTTLLFLSGILIALLFIGLRYINLYGDPARWQYQATPSLTVLSFINCEKYPPSLLYLLMTLGPAIAILPWLPRLNRRVSDILALFGKTPMFFYVLHLMLIVALSLANALMQHQFNASPIDQISSTGFPYAYGYDLPIVYLIWLIILAILYPLCRWFAFFKRRRQNQYPVLRYI